MKWTFIIFLFFGSTCLLGQYPISFLEIPKARFSIPHAVPSADHAVTANLIRGIWVVEAALDGREGAFILDTGAPMLAINRAPQTSGDLAASGFNGQVNVGTTQVGNFTWSGINLSGFTALELDISHMEETFEMALMGLIGYEVIQGYEIFFDYGAGQIKVLEPGANSLHKYFQPEAVIPITFNHHLPVIYLEMEGKRYAFGVDTGAGVNLLDQDVFDKLSASGNVEETLESLQGLNHGVKDSKSIIIREASLQKKKVSDLRFLQSDLSQLEAFSGLKLDGLLGFPFLKNFKFSINYPKKKLYLWGPGN